MGCAETLAGAGLIAALALLAGLGMLLRPRDGLAVGDWYFVRIEQKYTSDEERERVRLMRERLERRTREVRIGGVFYLLLALPFLLVVVSYGPAALAGTLPGC